ncbi:MAG: hypothetical protein ABIJ59_11415 [Pseudomonadota bacterium]
MVYASLHDKQWRIHIDDQVGSPGHYMVMSGGVPVEKKLLSSIVFSDDSRHYTYLAIDRFTEVIFDLKGVRQIG